MDMDELSEPTTDGNEAIDNINENIEISLEQENVNNEEAVGTANNLDPEYLQLRYIGNDPEEVYPNGAAGDEVDPLLMMEFEDAEAQQIQIPDELIAQQEDEDDELIFPEESRDEPNEVPRRWFIPVNHVHAAIRELVVQGRHGESHVTSMVNRRTFIQRLRRVIFSMDANSQRRRTQSNTDDENEFLTITDGQAETEEAAEQNEATALAEQRALEEAASDAVHFDTNLPAEHTYLGTNMDRVSGVNYLDVGKAYYMVLFMHQHILFPGEVLPFMISGWLIESSINADNGILFGICFPSLRGNENDTHIYGVTCQIYEKGVDARGNTVIKSRALQRFVTRSSEFSSPLQFIAGQPQLKCYGRVKILPEIYLPEPLKCINMGSMNRFRDNASMQQQYKRFQAATTPWPAHVYDDYSIGAFVEKAKAQLSQHKIDTMPTDPTQLSFWLVRNLHLSEDMMKTIFMTDSVNTRLKIISTTFREDAIFTCRYCGNRMANCRELFAMSKHGVQTQYCNSAGYIHKTNTVYQMLRDSISYSGEPSTEYSWFPGYQWHIIVCKVCTRHIGWEFKAVESNLVPKKFFGISSSSVRVSTPMPTHRLPHRAAIYRSFMRLARRELPR